MLLGMKKVVLETRLKRILHRFPEHRSAESLSPLFLQHSEAFKLSHDAIRVRHGAPPRNCNRRIPKISNQMSARVVMSIPLFLRRTILFDDEDLSANRERRLERVFIADDSDLELWSNGGLVGHGSNGR